MPIASLTSVGINKKSKKIQICLHSSPNVAKYCTKNAPGSNRSAPIVTSQLNNFHQLFTKYVLFTMARIAKWQFYDFRPLTGKGKAAPGVGLARCVLLSLLTQIASWKEISMQIYTCSTQWAKAARGWALERKERAKRCQTFSGIYVKNAHVRWSLLRSLGPRLIR